MGEFSLPTAADYAWVKADEAQKMNKSLEERIAALEKEVEKINFILTHRQELFR